MIYSGLLGFHDTTSWCDATMHKCSYLTDRQKKKILIYTETGVFRALWIPLNVISKWMDSKNGIKVQRSLLKMDLCKWGLRLLPRGTVIDAFSPPPPLWELYRYSGDIESLQIEISASPKKKKKPLKVYLQNTCTHIRGHKCDFTC